MRQYIGLMVIGLLCAEQALAASSWNADNCEAKGGERVIVSGQTFCRTTQKMQWWSIYSWCEVMGGHLPTIIESCPEANGLTNSGSCGRSYGTWVASRTPNNGNTMWAVNSSTLYGQALRSDYLFAWCLPN